MTRSLRRRVPSRLLPLVMSLVLSVLLLAGGCTSSDSGSERELGTDPSGTAPGNSGSAPPRAEPPSSSTATAPAPRRPLLEHRVLTLRLVPGTWELTRTGEQQVSAHGNLELPGGEHAQLSVVVQAGPTSAASLDGSAKARMRALDFFGETSRRLPDRRVAGVDAWVLRHRGDQATTIETGGLVGDDDFTISFRFTGGWPRPDRTVEQVLDTVEFR